ncbi:MAG: hypothetical protein Tsb0021_03600 [Chlamydiales bacterium]
MFLKKDDFEETLEQQEKDISKLEAFLEKLHVEVQSGYQELGMTPDELDRHLSNPSNFNREEWEYIQKSRDSLSHYLSSVSQEWRDQLKSKKARKSLSMIPNHAIFCR